MTKRLLQALRVLLGKPLCGVAIESTMLLDQPNDSEYDYTTKPPFDLMFGGVLANAPPEKIFREDRFRVCIFPEKNGKPCEGRGRTCRWLTLELRGGRTWYHLVAMHESRMATMMSVLQDVAHYLETSEGGIPS